MKTNLEPQGTCFEGHAQPECMLYMTGIAVSTFTQLCDRSTHHSPLSLPSPIPLRNYYVIFRVVHQRVDNRL